MRPAVSSMLFLAAVLVPLTGQGQSSYCPLTGQGQSSYCRLEPKERPFVDQAIDHANQRLNFGHLNFYEIGDIDQVSAHQVILDVRLLETNCTKASGAKHQHRHDCSFNPNKKVQVRCFVCEDRYNHQPIYIDCVRRSEEKERYLTWRSFCKPKGRFSLLAGEVPPPTISPDLTCYSGNGENYRGTVASTISGKTCQRWSDQSPHSHEHTPENYPCNHMDENYCRNPSNSRMPWCFTTDPQTRWEYCQVPRCVDGPEPTSEPTIFPELTCFTCKGLNYRGTVARTITGKTCQRWSAQTPHSHTRTPDKFPHKGLDNNYCRNPDNERMPWCYTTDPQTRWECCDVPRCAEPDY